jgi:vacuolar-type H+-ATPase subunit D/Vma8
MAEQIFPTKGNLIACKKNLTLAKLGFDLLDRKRNVLMREMMKLIDEAAGMQRAIGDTFIKAYKALESANITLGIEHALEGAVPEEKGFSVTGHSIMGVDLPTGHLASRPLYPASPAAMPSSTTPMSASIKSNSSARSSQVLKTAFTGWPWPSKRHSAAPTCWKMWSFPAWRATSNLFPARWKSMNAKNSRV